MMGKEEFAGCRKGYFRYAGENKNRNKYSGLQFAAVFFFPYDLTDTARMGVRHRAQAKYYDTYFLKR